MLLKTEFWWGNLREEDLLEDPDVDGRIILKWISEMWVEWGIDWIDLTQDRERWRAVVSGIMNFWVL